MCSFGGRGTVCLNGDRTFISWPDNVTLGGHCGMGIKCNFYHHTKPSAPLSLTMGRVLAKVIQSNSTASSAHEQQEQAPPPQA